ncbi:hypothetical protein D3C78_720460 [compost metagenome]
MGCNARESGDSCAYSSNVPLTSLIFLHKHSQIKSSIIVGGELYALLGNIGFPRALLLNPAPQLMNRRAIVGRAFSVLLNLQTVGKLLLWLYFDRHDALTCFAALRF